MEDGKLKGAVIESKSGRGAVRAKRVIDATDVESLSDAMIELRRQGVEMMEILSLHTKEFAHVKAGPFSALPGVRESRRIVTETMLSKEDVLTVSPLCGPDQRPRNELGAMS